MPRREDERFRNLSGKHPEACTCQDCTEKFLKKRNNKPARSLRKKQRPAEKVKRHPAGCDCVSCSLLTSVDLSATNEQGPGSIFKRFLGKG